MERIDRAEPGWGWQWTKYPELGLIVATCQGETRVGDLETGRVFKTFAPGDHEAACRQVEIGHVNYRGSHG